MGCTDQSVQEVDESEEGRVPRNVEVELLGDLVGCCGAGDEVTVLGFVRVLNTDTAKGISSHPRHDGGRHECCAHVHPWPTTCEHNARVAPVDV